MRIKRAFIDMERLPVGTNNKTRVCVGRSEMLLDDGGQPGTRQN